MNGIIKKFILTLIFALPAIVASETIINYSSTVTINAFFQWSDTLWVATSGGLRVHDLRTGNVSLLSNSRAFPDLYLTAVVRDSRGNLWISSRKGYLYKRTPRGQFTVYSNYMIAEWGITSLFSHDDLIVVGSNRGVSLFDPIKGVALMNATGIANFSNPRVNAIAASIMGDTLFLGCDDGVAYLDNLRSEPLAQRNFYYSGIWKTKTPDTTRAKRVVSFTQMPDSVMDSPVPVATFGGLVFKVVDGTRVMAFDYRGRTVITPTGDTVGVKMPNSGGITALYNEGDRRLWIGTNDEFYASLDGSEFKQYSIEGFTLRQASRVMADEKNGMWFLPSVPGSNQMWHHAVYRYDDRVWHRYNDNSLPGFGYMGDGAALAVAPGLNGTVWVGTSGGNLKHIDPAVPSVAQLIIGYGNFDNFNYVVDGIGDIMWGKSDALAVDASGYLWISVFDSKLGSLICYDQRHRPVSSLETTDPARARYRRFFTEQFMTRNITLLKADPDNRIFAYDMHQNRLVVFRHDGNPLANGIVIDTVFNGLGLVSAIEIGDNGDAYIAIADGLRKIARGSLRLESVDRSITNVTSMAVWESVIWLGTATNGILRYDLESGEKKWIDESSGMPSNNVISVAIEKNKARLWAVTDEGVSRIDVGRAAASAPREGFRAFPNVFSISGSGDQGTSYITFAGLDPRSSVSIYTLNGSLVAKVDAHRFTDREWRAEWTPRRGLSPGTYIVTTRPSGKKTKIILRP